MTCSTLVERRRIVARRTLLLSTILATGIAAPAFAQAAPTAISPLRVEPDINGVNVVSGRAPLPIPVLSVPAAPRLKFDWVQSAAPYVRSTTYGDPGSESDVAIQTTGDQSESFHCTDTDCESTGIGTGSTYKFAMRRFTQAGTGVVYTFGNKAFNELFGDKYQALYYASTITYPDGETLSFAYDSTADPGDSNYKYYRPTRITSSTGYYIKIAYASATFDPSAGPVTPTQATLYGPADPNTPLAQLTYNGTSITDLAGRTYVCSGCTNVLDAPLDTTSGSVSLPGESGNAVQYSGSAVSGANYLSVINSVTKDGVPWTYTYLNPRAPSCNGQVPNSATIDRLTVTGPNGYNVAYDINPAACGPASIAKITDSLGRSTQYAFDSLSRPVAMSAPEGNGVNVTYDGYANIVSKVTKAKPGSGLADITETAFVDNNNCQGVLCYRPVWLRDGLGRQTDLAYNVTGQLTQETAPADATGVRRVTYINYDASSGLSRKADERVCAQSTTCGTNGEFRTEYSYWNNTFLPSEERRVDQSTGQVLATDYTYDAAGRLLVKDGPLPGTSDAEYYRYDVVGRKTWEISAANTSGSRVVKRYTYRDADDKVVTVETGSLTDPNATSFTVTSRVDSNYDSRRYPVRDTVSSGGTSYSITDRSFDDRGHPMCETVRMNLASPPAAGSDACALGPQGGFGPDRVTSKSYDAAGQLLKTTKALGTADQADDATYTYSPNGKPTSLADGKGNLMAMGYDGFDRQASWTFPSPTTPGQVNSADYEAYGYDAAGNRTSLRKRDGATLTYQYDNLNRVTVKTVPTTASGVAGYGVYYGYDVRGLQTYALFGSASGPGVANAYDAFGRLVSSTTTMDGTSRTLTSQYDAAGNRTQLSGDAGYSASFTYDGAGRMTGYGNLAQLGYDGLGRRSSLAMGPGSTTSATNYGYDPIGRLASLSHDLAGSGSDVTQGFGYNPASQLTSETRDNDAYAFGGAVSLSRAFATNGLNQYTGVGSASLSYDANGNLTSDGSTSYAYDAENRLVQASGAKSASLSYDPLGHLWQVTGSAGTTRFLYDGDQSVMEYDSGGNLLRSFVHAADADEPLVWYEGGSRRYLHADHQGSIVSIADDGGNSVAINSYDEYGTPGASNSGRFQYTGQAWLAELGLYYYKARMYSPSLGRFMQTDPVGYKDQFNLYAYVADDPVNKTDPAGLACKTVGSATVCAEAPTGSLIPRTVSVTFRTSSTAVSAGASSNGVSLAARAGDASVVASAGQDGAVVGARAGDASLSASAGRDGAAIGARAGNASVSLAASGTGATAMARAGGSSVELTAGTIQPDKIPREYQVAKSVEGKVGRPDQVGLRPSPSTGTQRAVEGFRRVMSVLKDLFQ